MSLGVTLRAIIFVVVVLVVVVLALLLRVSLSKGSPLPPEEPVRGGTEEKRDSRQHDHVHGPLEIARYHHYKSLGSTVPITKARGGGPSRRAAKKKSWRDYSTWDELMDDPKAQKAYLEERSAVLNELNHDWSEVMEVVRPVLKEDREYIGLIDRDPKTKKLKVVVMKASPSKVGEASSPTALAEVPVELVEEVSRQPALFEFHTHPMGHGGSPLPSTVDFFGSILLSYTARYAASLVIGEYGIILHGLSPLALETIWKDDNPQLIAWRNGYDLVSAMHGKRSWGRWSLSEYTQMVERYQMMFVVYPTEEFVNDAYWYKYQTTSGVIDQALIEDLQKEISSLEKKASDGG